MIPSHSSRHCITALHSDTRAWFDSDPTKNSLYILELNGPVLGVPGVDRVVLEPKNESAGLLLNRRAPSSSSLLLLGYIDCRGCTTTWAARNLGGKRGSSPDFEIVR